MSFVGLVFIAIGAAVAAHMNTGEVQQGSQGEAIKQSCRTGSIATLPEETKEKIYADYEPTAEDRRDDSWKALKKMKKVPAHYSTICRF